MISHPNAWKTPRTTPATATPVVSAPPPTTTATTNAPTRNPVQKLDPIPLSYDGAALGHKCKWEPDGQSLQDDTPVTVSAPPSQWSAPGGISSGTAGVAADPAVRKHAGEPPGGDHVPAVRRLGGDAKVIR